MKQEDGLKYNEKRLRQITQFEADYRINHQTQNCRYDPHHQSVEIEIWDSIQDTSSRDDLRKNMDSVVSKSNFLP